MEEAELSGSYAHTNLGLLYFAATLVPWGLLPCKRE